MYVVVVGPKNKDGKIELTKAELQKMLDEAYAKGKADAETYQTITVPSTTWKPYYNWTISSEDMKTPLEKWGTTCGSTCQLNSEGSAAAYGTYLNI